MQDRYTSLYPDWCFLEQDWPPDFPVMLGITGERFKDLSGTAFSFVISVALIGNMLVNYMMGLISGKYGISNLTTVAFIEMSLQVILFTVIIGSLKINHK